MGFKGLHLNASSYKTLRSLHNIYHCKLLSGLERSSSPQEIHTEYRSYWIPTSYTHKSSNFVSHMPLFGHNWSIMREPCILEKNWIRESIAHIKIPLYTCIACPYYKFIFLRKISKRIPPIIDHNWSIMRKPCILDQNWLRESIPRIKIPL